MRRQAILLLMALAAAMVVAGGVAYAATFTCDTPEDQDPAPGQCTGTEEADTINGTDDPDEVRALAGDDTVFPNAGNDVVYLDKGNDVTDANVGNDTIYGGPDGDGSAQGTDFSFDNLEGAEDSDKVYGGGGSDWIDAAAFDVNSGSVDISSGGRGNDHIYAIDNNEDKINCGRGRDVAFVDQEQEPRLDSTKGCEQVIVED